MTASTTKKTASPKAPSKAPAKKTPTLSGLQTEINELRKTIELNEKKHSMELAGLFRMLGNTFSQQGQRIQDSVFPPTYQLKQVDDEEEMTSPKTITLILEKDGNVSILGRTQEGQLAPIPKEEAAIYPAVEFMKEIKAKPGTLVQANLYRIDGAQNG